VKLIELEPRWIHSDLFVFRCPHCRKDWLTCKRISMPDQVQYDLYEQAFGADWNMEVVPCSPSFAWSIVGEFENLTVTPSIDASKSGHWHGHITNGEIQ
jgi:hypothetical protein